VQKIHLVSLVSFLHDDLPFAEDFNLREISNSVDEFRTSTCEQVCILYVAQLQRVTSVSRSSGSESTTSKVLGGFVRWCSYINIRIGIAHTK
jgi:hypothetical protein